MEEAEELLRRYLVMIENVHVTYVLYWLGVCVREADQLEEEEELPR